MAKRLSEEKRRNSYNTNGTSIEELAKNFKSTQLTIKRNLKKILGENEYKEFSQKKNYDLSKDTVNRQNISLENKDESHLTHALESPKDENFQHTAFMEITPLNYEIENSLQKDLASMPIKEVQLPNIVYMIVDKNIELAIKDLKDYPNGISYHMMN